MFWLVESKDQLNRFCNSNYKEAFVEIIPYNNSIHPSQNEVCAVYIRPLLATKGYVLPKEGLFFVWKLFGLFSFFMTILPLQE